LKELIFKRAEASDKEEIYALYRSLIGTEFCAWSDSYPGWDTIQFDLDRESLFCLKDSSGRIVGVISIDDDEAVRSLHCWSADLKPVEELSRLGVHPDWQNKGIARLLLTHAMDELRRQGKQGVHFLVCKTNLKAIRSYNKLGFDVVGECELFGEEWWCYEKHLLQN